MSTKLPVVFLAFANDMDSHLATLKDESRALYSALQPLEQTNAIAVHREESVEFDELYQDLLAFDGRIVVFHYAGHADGTMLQLEGGNGGAGGIATLLGQQTSLKLVFLNGCATKDQVRLLHDAGVPAVIATAVKISDTKATQLSSAFYAALVKGHSIFEAFELAKGYIEGKFDGESSISFAVNRHPNFNFAQQEQENSPSLEFEWTLYTREDCVSELEQWRLTHAQQDWVVRLQDTNGVIRDFDDKPIEIQYQARSRTLDVLTCLNCHTTTSLIEGSLQHCPLCDSSDTKLLQAQSNVPELDISFSIDRQKAQDIALAASGLTNPESAQAEKISLQKVLIPFWVFDLEIRSQLKAQRGAIKDIHADTIALEWEEVSEDIDLIFESFMVPGFSGQISTNQESVDWQWSLDESTNMSQLSSSISVIPFDVSPQAGFEQFFAYLSKELADEAFYRAGGQQQKNVSFDTRYKHISLRSIFLPHWCAVLSHDKQTTSIIINGQTGAIRFSPLPNKPAIANMGQTSMNQKNATQRSETNNVSAWVSVFSGIGIGVMVGLLMGLAAPQDEGAKSIVAIFIGAVGVVLAALLGLNDRHFSAAKGLRIGSFGLAVAVSASLGVFVRDHGLFTPNLEERAKEVREVFKSFEGKENDEKVIRLLAAMDAGAKIAKVYSAGQEPALGAGIQTKSFHYNGVAPDKNVCTALLSINDEQATEFSVLYKFGYYDEQGKLGWKSLADKANKAVDDKTFQGNDLLRFLLISRSALCGGPPYNKRIELPANVCKKDADISTENWINAFKDNAESQMLLANLQNDLTQNAQSIAMGLLGPALCPVIKGEDG